jgi:hypothetical protein
MLHANALTVVVATSSAANAAGTMSRTKEFMMADQEWRLQQAI